MQSWRRSREQVLVLQEEVLEQILVFEEKVSEQVLKWVLKEAWCTVEGYLEEKQLTWLSST